MWNNGHDAYLESRVMTADPVELINLLYQACTQSVRAARAHLAGGLGVPVWLATAYAPDWRWMKDREDSPWYPTMRLFRQTKVGHWEDVFQRMATVLAPGS